MSKFEKIMIRILSGTMDKDIEFEDLKKVLHNLGFTVRIKGSHHIYYKEDIEEILHLQPIGAKAKPYQVKQVRQIIFKYKLGGDLDV